MANLVSIQNKIHEVRSQKVMLDFDIAEIYQIQTKVLNQAVKRNADRFPLDFMFRLTEEEWNNMRSQIVTASEATKGMRSPTLAASQKKRNIKMTPYAFTEHGVTMLASVLSSPRAIKMSIAVVRAFISLKHVALEHKDLAKKLEELRNELHERIGEHDVQLAAIYDAIESLLDEKAKQKNWQDRQRIGFR